MVSSAPNSASSDPSGQPMPNAVWRSPVGPVGVFTAGVQLVGIRFLPDNTPQLAPRDAYAGAVIQQIQAYFQDPAWRFDLRLDTRGTAFQERVWAGLRRISAGRVRTYGALAETLGTAPRAIGGACRANPCPLVTPCHRVVSVGGLGGFMGHRGGHALEIKHWLLRHEGVVP